MDLPPLPDDPSVAVVVPARDAAATLADALAAAAQQPVDDIVVAVGPSDDGTAGLAARLAGRHPAVRVVDNPAGSTPAGLNTAIAATPADVIVRCDAHAVLPAGYVARAVRVLRETGAATVGGRQVPEAPAGGMQAAVAAAMVSPAGSGGAAWRSGTTAGPADSVYLGVFRRAALEAVPPPGAGAGPFDESLRRNQDWELNLRLREAGGTVWFDPELAVAYRPRASLRALARQYLDYGRYRRRTARLHPGSLRLRQLAPPALLLALAGTAAAAALGQPVGLLLLVGAYAGVVVVAAALAAPRAPLAPAVAAALVVMHTAWGAGFLTVPAARPARQEP